MTFFYFAYGADMNATKLSRRLGRTIAGPTPQTSAPGQTTSLSISIPAVARIQIGLPGRPGVVTGRSASVSGYRLAFNKIPIDGTRDVGYANLVRDPGQTVYGVLYRLDSSSMKVLARANPGYELEPLGVATEDEQPPPTVAASAFIARDEGFLDDTRLPTREHVSDLLEASQLLPPEYADTLRWWLALREVDEFQLTPASSAALAVADERRSRDNRRRIHMEHLIEGLFAEENGPAHGVLAPAGLNDESSLMRFLLQASEADGNDRPE